MSQISATIFTKTITDKLAVKVDPTAFKKALQANAGKIPETELFKILNDAIRNNRINSRISDLARKAETAAAKQVLPRKTINDALMEKLHQIDRTRPVTNAIVHPKYLTQTAQPLTYNVTPALEVWKQIKTSNPGLPNEAVKILYEGARRDPQFGYNVFLKGPEGLLPKTSAETKNILKNIFK